MFQKSWHAKLAAQLIQSMREHPEDWEVTYEEYRIRNEHLRISIWARKSIRHLDVSWKGRMIIAEDQRSWWVPQWRVRLFKAAKYAQKNCGLAKLSVAVGDTLSGTETTPDRISRIIRRVISSRQVLLRR